MSEPLPKLDAALKQVTSAWDDGRTQRTLAGAQRKQAQARVRSRVIAGGAAVLIAAMAVLAVVEARRVEPKTLATERSVSFADGSRALLLDASAQVVVDRVSDTAIDVRLPAGRALFEVAPRKTRTFQVVCDEVVVQVIGTAFELQREGARTHVKVVHGRVAVRWPGGAIELGAGDAGWFPAKSVPAVGASATQVSAPSALEESDLHAEDEALKAEAAGSRRARAETWRQHAEQGDFQEAYQLLERERERVSDDVEELLLAADSARLSGHAAQAVPFLQRVIERHAADPRAPLAAFTLGGVLMNQLGRPREAEGAYGRARAMSPSSALSQDALARQVEAAHRASDAAHARTLALEYLERYPDGRRVKAVRRFGGLP